MRLARRCLGASLFVALAIACTGSAPAHDPPPPRDVRSPCAALCDHLAACGPPPDFEGVAGCTRTCETDPRQLAGPCRDPRLAYETCMVAQSCADVRASHDLEVAKQGPCAAALAAVIACEPGEQAPFIYFQF